MWLLSLLFVYGCLPFISCEDCIERILQCSNVRNQTESREFLPDTDESLEELCRSQEPYIRCVFDVAISCTEELSGLVKLKFLSNEGFFQQFCRRGSDWWTSYLEISKCVNRRKFQVCIVSDYIGALKDQYDIERKCSALNEILACVARIISKKCGSGAEDLFLSLAVLTTDYDFKCALVGRKSDGETISVSKRSISPDAEEINQLKINLGSEPGLQLSVSEDEEEETILNSTEILRRIGENLHDAAQEPSMSSTFVMQDEIKDHSSVEVAENTKLYDETTERPLVTPVTFVTEPHEISQELNEETNAESDVAAEIPLVTAETLITKPHEAQQEYSNKGSNNYIYLEDTESSGLEDAGSATDSHHIKYLENVRYFSDPPKVFVLDLSKNFASRAMSIIRKFLDPNLDIEAFKYSDETVRVYWEHPFVLPFETLVCRQADLRERFFGKSFTCVLTLPHY
ncbi:uncharacterized protein LOC118195355 [Stegodyphus dumicola]|uniref:uncharacterized protein LOC118195355 n=1 Tax=Stegodyphus dumicola TaxID=202533 RepID=UPI0015A7F26A|nr:uncharacterized protein LOC118195355 [Stegodyphus dumicola]